MKFDYTNAETAVVIPRNVREDTDKNKGIITYINGNYLLKADNKLYHICNLQPEIGHYIYSTHLNDKQKLGTQRVLHTLKNLDKVLKVWYLVYDTMKIDYEIISITNATVKLKKDKEYADRNSEKQ